MKCQNLSSLTVEIAFKRCKQTIKYQCWCGVNFPTDLKCQILSSLTLKIAFKGRKEANIYIYIYIYIYSIYIYIYIYIYTVYIYIYIYTLDCRNVVVYIYTNIQIPNEIQKYLMRCIECLPSRNVLAFSCSNNSP